MCVCVCVLYVIPGLVSTADADVVCGNQKARSQHGVVIIGITLFNSRFVPCISRLPLLFVHIIFSVFKTKYSIRTLK